MCPRNVETTYQEPQAVVLPSPVAGDRRGKNGLAYRMRVGCCAA